MKDHIYRAFLENAATKEMLSGSIGRTCREERPALSRESSLAKYRLMLKLPSLIQNVGHANRFPSIIETLINQTPYPIFMFVPCVNDD